MVENNVLTDAVTIYALADIDDLSRSLVAQDQWRRRWEQSLRDVDVRAAHADGADADHNVVRSHDRVRDVAVLKVAAAKPCTRFQLGLLRLGPSGPLCENLEGVSRGLGICGRW